MQTTVIHTLPHAEQRYNTAGDWYDNKTWATKTPGAQTVITVSELGDDDMEFCVAVHELIEAHLCRKRGISQEAVDAFDIAHEKSGGEGEPGDMPDAPYAREHSFASAVERVLAQELGVDWQEFERRIQSLKHPNSEAVAAEPRPW